MRKLWSVMNIGFVALGLMGCGRSQSDVNNAEPNDSPGPATTQLLSPSNFQSTYADTGGLLLDVRTASEVAAGRIEEARNIDVRGGDFESQAETLDKSQPVFVYCRSGGRSADAASRLSQLGFTEIYDLEGGITAWKEAGLPVVE